jgi:ribosome maturation protein SDO1
MANVEAKLSLKGKRYEVLVDVDKAVQLKKGIPVSMDNVLAINEVFSDVKKGIKLSKNDLKDAFGTEDVKVIAEKIIKNGEVNIPLEMRKAEQENKVKQVVDFLSRNALDPRTGRPYTPNAIENAISQAGVKIENKPIDSQIQDIISKLRTVLPVKIETKKLKITIPALHSGKVYSLVKEYKEKEDWLGNGDLQVVVNIPAGLQMEFYDKLNGVTHGSSVVEDISKA